ARNTAVLYNKAHNANLKKKHYTAVAPWCYLTGTTVALRFWHDTTMLQEWHRSASVLPKVLLLSSS
ncbi:hypothetical protein PanWU01x14_318890, partial [Parasponia andersonii]